MYVCEDPASRNKCIETIQQELDALKERLYSSSMSSSKNASSHKNRRTLSRDEVMEKAGFILKDTYAGKYFHVYTEEGLLSAKSKNACKASFRFYYDIVEEKVKEDQRLDGTFLIQTNQRNE